MNLFKKGERAISFKKFVSLVTEKNLFTSDKQKKFGEDVQTYSQVFILIFYFNYKKIQDPIKTILDLTIKWKEKQKIIKIRYLS